MHTPFFSYKSVGKDTKRVTNEIVLLNFIKIYIFVLSCMMSGSIVVVVVVIPMRLVSGVWNTDIRYRFSF